MKQKVLIVLINTNSLESTFKALDIIEDKILSECDVLLVDNGSIEEKILRSNHLNYRCVKEYVSLPESNDVGVVLANMSPVIGNYNNSHVFFVSNAHDKTIGYLPLLMSMSKVSRKSVLGIKGGSFFSVFFHNAYFFQINTGTDWLRFNGMLIPMAIWKKQINLIDVRYFKGFIDVNFGYKLIQQGFDLFKLKPYVFSKKRGLENYFRMRNPFLFMLTNIDLRRYLIGIFYFMIQLPYAIYHYKKDGNYLSGLWDGLKLLLLKNPNNT